MLLTQAITRLTGLAPRRERSAAASAPNSEENDPLGRAKWFCDRPILETGQLQHSGCDANPVNPLEAFFAARTVGRGVWKWVHYFDIYHRHLSRFVGLPVHFAEVGVYSGGSLDMWRHYLGPQCMLYGIDIQPECRAYEDAGTKIFIGDQADRTFWQHFRDRVPDLDVVVDDGGHETVQQIVTAEEVLPHLRPGGVYICEDIHGLGNEFARFVYSLADRLNAMDMIPARAGVTGVASRPTGFQNSIYSIHLYPYVAVIDKRCSPLERFEAPKHGSQWQPFL